MKIRHASKKQWLETLAYRAQPAWGTLQLPTRTTSLSTESSEVFLAIRWQSHFLWNPKLMFYLLQNLIFKKSIWSFKNNANYFSIELNLSYRRRETGMLQIGVTGETDKEKDFYCSAGIQTTQNHSMGGRNLQVSCEVLFSLLSQE